MTDNSPHATDQLIANNAAWAEDVESVTPGYFAEHASAQSPSFVWIGCADSRVPASRVTSLGAGELFVHRNIANVVKLDDPSCMSVLEFSIHTLKVSHVVVCGHTMCGGVKAAMDGLADGVLGDWLSGIRDLHAASAEELATLSEEDAFLRMCELNVRDQVGRVCRSPAVARAWEAGQALTVHGLLYDLRDGRLQDLDLHVSSAEDVIG